MRRGEKQREREGEGKTEAASSRGRRKKEGTQAASRNDDLPVSAVRGRSGCGLSLKGTEHHYSVYVFSPPSEQCHAFPQGSCLPPVGLFQPLYDGAEVSPLHSHKTPGSPGFTLQGEDLPHSLLVSVAPSWSLQRMGRVPREAVIFLNGFRG